MPAIRAIVELGEPSVDIHAEVLDDDDGVILAPSAPATLYLELGVGFSLGFNADGEICDIDTYLNPRAGDGAKFSLPIDERLHTLRLGGPIDASGDTVSAWSGKPRVDRDVGLWWFQTEGASKAIRIGRNIYAIVDVWDSSFCGVALKFPSNDVARARSRR
jgi:hypothetical protein